MSPVGGCPPRTARPPAENSESARTPAEAREPPSTRLAQACGRWLGRLARANSWVSKQRSETGGRRSRSPAGRCRRFRRAARTHASSCSNRAYWGRPLWARLRSLVTRKDFPLSRSSRTLPSYYVSTREPRPAPAYWGAGKRAACWIATKFCQFSKILWRLSRETRTPGDLKFWVKVWVELYIGHRTV